MEYHGKLYVKIGNKYFDTGKTSNDFDEMFEMLKSISNERDDIVHDEIKVDIKKLLTKITQ